MTLAGPEPAGAAGAPPAMVGPFLARALDDPRWDSCSTTLIAGGKSNLTYVVASDAGEVVLRRPPLGSALPTAHDMAREVRVQRALAPTRVPVPRVLAHEADDALLGQPFYVMEKVDGHVARETLPAGYAESPAQRRAVGEGLVDVLVTLHATDWQRAGLRDHGRPEGFLERQVNRWVGQWHASKTADLPALDELADVLARTLPVQRDAVIVHGDYRLDNALLHPAEPGRIAAVLDWELSTIGDPLVDLGLLLVYWTQTDDSIVVSGLPTVTALPGFPQRADVVERYAAASSRPVDDLPWYVAFGAFKLAVVLAGVAMRAREGAMVGEGFDRIADRVPELVELGRRSLAKPSLAAR